MSLKKTTIAALLAASGLVVSSASMAQGKPADTGFYAGATIGQSDFSSADCSGVTCDTKDTAFRILGGYQINRNFAAEIGYHDLGKLKVSAPGLSGEVKANAFELVGLGAFPINQQFSIYGKLGFYRGEAKLSGDFGDGKETNTDLTYGVGVQYNFNRQLGVRGEWQRYSKLGGDDTGGDSDVDVLSIGVVFRFQ